MIFTKVRVKNLYCFVDTELNLTYPRKIADSNIEYEYLDDRAPNFRFKRLCIISGANASGKTSFGKVLLQITNAIHKGRIFTEQNKWSISNEALPAEIEVEFVFPTVKELKFRTLILRIEKGIYNFQYAEVPINKSDSVDSCREKISNLMEAKESRGKFIYLDNIEKGTYHDRWDELHNILSESGGFSNTVWTYDISYIAGDYDTKSRFIDHKNKGYTKVLSNVLRTFDPSIEKVNEVFELDKNNEAVVKGYNIYFPNGKFCRLDESGLLDHKYSFLFSKGTHQAISVAGFTHQLIEQMKYPESSGIFFLDEQMSYSHTDLEREMVNLLAQKTNRYSQFFYTTHNYDIFEMDFPLHSFVFLRKSEDQGPEFIWADSVCNKNDRNILNYVKNNYFNTIPDVSLLDEILWGQDDEDS